jgi:hypothetical protein
MSAAEPKTPGVRRKAFLRQNGNRPLTVTQERALRRTATRRSAFLKRRVAS